MPQSPPWPRWPRWPRQHRQTPSASASVSNLTWQLIDLNPGDGISPEISFFGDGYHGTQLSYYLPWSVEDSLVSNEAGSHTLQFDRASTSANTTANAVSAQAALSTGGEYATARAISSYSLGFRLTPYTGVLFAASAEADAASLAPGRHGSAQAYLRGSVGNFLTDDGHPSFETRIWSGNDPVSQVLRGYVHSDSLAVDGSVSISVDVDAITFPGPPPPVPESASIAMLLAGLAVVGAGVARKRA